MSRPILRTLLASAAALVAASAAAARPIVLDPSPSAPARAVAAAVFRDFLAGKAGAELRTAAVDLDGDGVAEVAARFVHTSTCQKGASLCRTVVLRHDGRNWAIVLDRNADELEQSDAGLSVDGAAWTWNGSAYAPSLDGMGTQLAFAPVPAANLAPIASAFGQGAAKLSAAGLAKFDFVRTADLGGDHIVARMSGGAACGMVSGCPVRVLRNDGNSWRTVLATGTTAGVAVRGQVRAGNVRDIAVATPKGYVVMGWTGSEYAVADTVEAAR